MSKKILLFYLLDRAEKCDARDHDDHSCKIKEPRLPSKRVRIYKNKSNKCAIPIITNILYPCRLFSGGSTDVMLFRIRLSKQQLLSFVVKVGPSILLHFCSLIVHSPKDRFLPPYSSLLYLLYDPEQNGNYYKGGRFTMHDAPWTH